MRFEDWPVLGLMIFLLFLYRWWRRRNQPPKVTFSMSVPSRLRKKNPVRLLLLIRYLALVFLLIALARPQMSYERMNRQVSGVEIMLVMDISASMKIEDLGDRPRIKIAKETIKKFIKGRQNDRIGFSVFSGEPVTLAPPTLDYGLVLKAIRNIQVGSLKDGTAIGDGLSLAVNHLKDSRADSKVMILLTDGDNNVGKVDPKTAGELAKGYDIRTYTIAIGTEGRVKLPLKRQGPFGKTIKTYRWFENALNPELLKKVAKMTNGKFYRVTDAKTLKKVFDEIDRLEETEMETTSKLNYRDVFQWPLKIGIVLLLIEKLLAWGWWRLIL